MNGRQAEIARQAARGRAGVHPGQFKRDQRQRQILRAGDKSALFRVQERGGDAALVEVRQQAVFSAVHSCELRPPAATSRATGPRATPRAACTSICNS
jgi:hypothetical protein